MTSAPTDEQVLELASRRYNRPGARDQAALAELGLTGTQFAVRLLGIVERPAPDLMASHGLLLARLQRILAVERGRRSAVRRSA